LQGADRLFCAHEPLPSLPAAKGLQHQSNENAHGLVIFADFNKGDPTKRKVPEWAAGLWYGWSFPLIKSLMARSLKKWLR